MTVSGTSPEMVRPAVGSFRADVQGMRGLAVLLVVLFHANGLLTGGFVGVDVFFVISGFLIGGLLFAELDRTGHLDLVQFFSRRIRRLLPALATTTVITTGLALFLVPAGDQMQATASTAVAASLFVANLHLYRSSGYFQPDAETNPLLHTWSLSVEEQFYFLLPLVLVLAVRLGRGDPVAHRRVAQALVGIGVAASLALSWWSVSGPQTAPLGGNEQLGFYAPMTRAWEFGLGVLLASRRAGTATATATAARRGWHAAASGLGLGLILFAAITFDDTTPFPGVTALLPVVGTMLLLQARPANPLNAVLRWQPLVWLGDRSYSWYLWHWPLIVFTRHLWPGRPAAVAIAAVCSLLPAAWSYRYVEQPFRRRHTLVGPGAFRLAATCILLPIVAGVGAVALNGAVPARIDLATAERPGLDAVFERPPVDAPPWPVGCDGEDTARCRAGPEDDTRPSVVLVGDSHAEALAPELGTELERRGYWFSVLIEPGCPFLQGPRSPRNGCGDWQATTMATLLDDPPSMVVIHGYTTGRITGVNSGRDVGFEIASEAGVQATDEREALALYEEGITSAVETLTRAGVPVTVVSSVPDFDRPAFAEVTVWRVLRGDLAPDNAVIAASTAAARNAGIITVERSLDRSNPLVEVVDPLPVLCTTICSQIDGDDSSVLYRDEDHLTPIGAGRLAVAVAEAVSGSLEVDAAG
jgi:peptidoglycan/LPS O-acetylase OafA/YrhL